MKKFLVALSGICILAVLASCQKFTEISVNGSWEIESITSVLCLDGETETRSTRTPMVGDIYKVTFFANSEGYVLVKVNEGENPIKETFVWGRVKDKIAIIFDESSADVIFNVKQNSLESMTFTAKNTTTTGYTEEIYNLKRTK